VPDVAIVPDSKDWTWVLARPCTECGYDANVVDRADIPRLVREATSTVRDALGRRGAPQRPDESTWSDLEYGCHVRDVCRVFDERLSLLLAEDDPLFANWDQDRTAREERYADQDALVVADELAAAADGLAGRYASVRDEQWSRSGRRSNGSVFTVESLGRYLVHDLVHHVHDVSRDR
jgi:hypothetical protein